MGLLSSAKSLIGKSAPYVGAMFGPAGAAAGTAVSGFLNSDTGNSLTDFASSAYDIYSQNKQRSALLQAQDAAYQQSLMGIQMQNASARELQDRANAFNADQAQRTNDFNSREAGLQRSWSEYMSGTAHQREIADLKAAGLNPILSGTGGMGSSSPSGSSASGVAARAEAPPVRSQGDAVTAAFQAMTSMADAFKASSATALMNGPQSDLIRSQIQNTRADTGLKGQQTTLTGALTGKASADTLLSIRQGIKTVYDAANSLSSNPKIQQEITNLKTINNNLQKNGRLTDAQIQQTAQSTLNLKATYLDLKMKGEISDTEYGKLMEQINRSPLGEIIKLVK
jgi:hypothetical protein